jgi:uncharacterized protein (TIGR02453 family)
MSYFTTKFPTFFKELAANNNREWFHENKKIYEAEVKKPLYAFIQDVIDAVGKIEGDLHIEVKDTVFRINRDIRFSPDKSPYKPHVGAIVSSGGRKNMQIPGIYLQLSAAEHFIGGGSYMPDKVNLTKIRNAIKSSPEAYRKIISGKKFLTHYPEGIQGEKNKILPKEFKPYMDDIPELLNKQFYCMAKHKGQKFVTQDNLLDVVMDHYRAMKDLNGFLANAIK